MARRSPYDQCTYRTPTTRSTGDDAFSWLLSVRAYHCLGRRVAGLPFHLRYVEVSIVLDPAALLHQFESGTFRKSSLDEIRERRHHGGLHDRILKVTVH